MTMVDFRKMISPASSMQIKKRNQAIMDFQELGPIDMADELLRHSRRMIDSGAFSPDPRYSYDEWALRRVVPELALRLNPDIELRQDENPTEAERADALTYLRGGDPEDLKRSIASILSNASFRRINLNDPDPEDVFSSEVLFSHRPNALSIAANSAFPGTYPEVATTDDREDLPGFFIIETMESGYNSVLRYCDNIDLAECYMDVAIAAERGDDLSDSDLALSRDMHRIGSRKDPVSVSIQNFNGDVLKSREIKEEPEESFAP
jgi:hypothetical protein